MNSKKEIIISILISIFIIFFSVVNTYSAFTMNIEKTGSITTTSLSSTFLSDSEFVDKVKQIATKSGVTIDEALIDKSLIQRVNDLPTIEFTNENVVSTSDSDVPIYLWIENNVIYYYTIATNISQNNDVLQYTNMLQKNNILQNTDISPNTDVSQNTNVLPNT